MCCEQACCCCCGCCGAISPLWIGKFFTWLFSLFIDAELDVLVPAAEVDDDEDADADEVDADEVDADAVDVDAADVDALGPAIPLVDGSSAVLLLQLRQPKFWPVLPES